MLCANEAAAGQPYVQTKMDQSTVYSFYTQALLYCPGSIKKMIKSLLNTPHRAAFSPGAQRGSQPTL